MLFSENLFRSWLFAPHQCAHSYYSRGYSLVELAATIVMIAGIAVLSLPTYQDFGPHEEFAGTDPVQKRQEPLDSDAETASNDQSMNQPVDEEANRRDSGRAEESVDPDRAVR